MERKIIKQASQAYTITLPIEWVRRNGLDKKREVELEEEGRNLIVHSKGKVEGRKMRINLNGIDKRQIRTHLGALYAKGIDELEIEYDEDISSTLIEDLRGFIGFILVNKKDNVYFIKDVAGERPQDLDEIFKRVFQMIMMFYGESIKDIFGKRKVKHEGLVMRDSEVNKFTLYLERAINKMSYSEAIDAMILFAYSFSLEKIGDEIYRLWETGLAHKIPDSKKLRDFASLTQKALELSFDLYYQFDPKGVGELRKIKKKIREEELRNKKVDTITARVTRHLLKISEEAADLSHLTLIKNY